MTKPIRPKVLPTDSSIQPPPPLLPIKGRVFRDGEPCGHPGCLSHVSHPCEGCGRVGGYRVNDTTCPRCGSASVYREIRCLRPYSPGGGQRSEGWYVCRACWYKWDGITDNSTAVLPAGVVARGKPELEEEEIE